jgi:hypothetical protein
MTLLLLRITLAPVLILAGSLAQRRWGQAIGGRLIGLPLTSLPLLFVLTLSDGTTFAAGAARASLAGGVAQCAWCLAYAIAARRHRPVAALALATAVFAGLCGLLDLVALPTVLAAVASAVAVVAALALWPAAGPARSEATGGRNDVAVRMVVAAVFTLALTESAASLGARPAGLVAAFPLLTVVLAVATHRRDGVVALNRFLHGVMAGSFSVVAALTVVAMALPHAGRATTFAVAVTASVLAQCIPTSRPRVLDRLVDASHADDGRTADCLDGVEVGVLGDHGEVVGCGDSGDPQIVDFGSLALLGQADSQRRPHRGRRRVHRQGVQVSH